jgi:hypothetical protein
LRLVLASWLAQKAVATAEQTRQLWMNDSGHLLVKDQVGHEIGFDRGKLVNTLPGAHVSP